MDWLYLYINPVGDGLLTPAIALHHRGQGCSKLAIDGIVEN
jgi:hypothetical protein